MKRALSAVAALAAAVTLTPLPLGPLGGPGVADAVTCTVTVRLSPGAAAGTTAAAVKCLEQRLRELGYAVGTPDGVYDTASVNAVKAFQRIRGLYPDGLVTSITGRQLGLRGPLPPAGSPKVTVIGDSTSAAMRWYDEARNETTIYDVMGTTYDLAWNIESCKRLVATSCVGRTDPGTGLRWRPVSVLPEMRGSLKGRLGDALVIMAGYDDYPSIADDIDAIMAEAEAQGVSRVFWLSFRTTSAYSYGVYYRQHNQALMAARTRHPNLVVLDWNTYTHRQTAAVQSEWVASDGIHLTRAGGLALARWLKVNIDASQAPRCASSRATTGTPFAGGSMDAMDPSPVGFSPDQVQRVADTRTSGAKLGAGRVLTVDLSAVAPADATYAMLHVTALEPCRAGLLRIDDCNGLTPRGPISFESGRTTVGEHITKLSSDHRVCIHTSAATDVTVDVTGWYTPAGDPFHPVPQARLVDSRAAAPVALPGPLAAGASVTVDVPESAAVPAGASAVWLNVAATAGDAVTSLQVRPGACGTSPQGVAVVPFRGRTAISAVVLPLTDRKLCLTASTGGAVHVAVDVWGWFGTNSPGLLYRERLTGARLAGPLAAGSTAQFTSATTSGAAVLVATASSGAGALWVRPCGTGTRPLLGEAPRELVANVAVVPVSPSPACATTSSATYVAVHQVGEFVPTPP